MWLDISEFMNKESFRITSSEFHCTALSPLNTANIEGRETCSNEVIINLIS